LLMENAGAGIAGFVKQRWGGEVALVLVGSGNNGGGVLVAARHLLNSGFSLDILITGEPNSDRSRMQLDILRKMNASIYNYDDLKQNKVQELFDSAEFIIDGLIGYGLKGEPQGGVADLINYANNSGKIIISNDIPSGLDGDSGLPSNNTIKADSTLVLALPKVGLLKSSASNYVGEMYLVDISVPKIVYEKMGLNVPEIFQKSSIVKLV